MFISKREHFPNIIRITIQYHESLLVQLRYWSIRIHSPCLHCFQEAWSSTQWTPGWWRASVGASPSAYRAPSSWSPDYSAAGRSAPRKRPTCSDWAAIMTARAFMRSVWRQHRNVSLRHSNSKISTVTRQYNHVIVIFCGSKTGWWQ